MDAKAKIFLTLAAIFVFLGGLLIYQASTLGKLRLIFCDIGQGDGILVVTPAGKQILIDSGPGKRIGQCLSSKMPFWDRNIELMVPTHFQKDHIEGQIDVFSKYDVENVVTTKIAGDLSLAVQWNRSLAAEKSNVYVPKAGEKIVVDGVTFEVVWPTSEALAGWKENLPKDLNETSIVMRMVWQTKHGQSCAYFTGDIPWEILENIASKPCDLLKLAHHGSKTGTSDLVLEKINPKIAVIQVGKNSYGHPAVEVLRLLANHDVKVLRNDMEGTIEVDGELNVSGGK